MEAILERIKLLFGSNEFEGLSLEKRLQEVKAIGDALMLRGEEVSTTDWELFFTYVSSGALFDEETTPIQKWVMHVLDFKSISQDERVGLIDGYKRFFKDEWSLRKLREFTGEEKPQYGWSSNEYYYEAMDRFQVKMDEDFGSQGSEVWSEWISEAYELLKKKTNSPWAHALMAHASQNREFEFEVAAGPKSWKVRMFQTAFLAYLKKLGLNVGVDEKKMRNYDFKDLRDLSGKIIENPAPHFQDEEDLKALYFLAMGLGICPYKVQDQMIDHFPGKFFSERNLYVKGEYVKMKTLSEKLSAFRR